MWELSPDRFEEMDVVEGDLFRWPVGSEVYECYHYNPETNTAVAGWRGSPADSQLAGGVDLDDAYQFIEDLRDEYEPAQRKLDRIRNRMRLVAREMDRRRLENHNRMLDPALTPDFAGEDGRPAGVGDVIRDQFPDELLPEQMREGDDENQDVDEEEEFVEMAVLDEQEPMRND